MSYHDINLVFPHIYMYLVKMYFTMIFRDYFPITMSNFL